MTHGGSLEVPHAQELGENVASPALLQVVGALGDDTLRGDAMARAEAQDQQAGHPAAGAAPPSETTTDTGIPHVPASVFDNAPDPDALDEPLLATRTGWLLRHTLLPARLYLTQSYLHIQAVLDGTTDRDTTTSALDSIAEVHAGWLRRTVGSHARRQWATLRNCFLSWVERPEYRYYPLAHMDLRSTDSVAPSGEDALALIITMPHGRVVLQADTSTERDAWVRAIAGAVQRHRELASVRLVPQLEGVASTAKRHPVQQQQQVRFTVPVEALVDVQTQPTPACALHLLGLHVLLWNRASESRSGDGDWSVEDLYLAGVERRDDLCTQLADVVRQRFESVQEPPEPSSVSLPHERDGLQFVPWAWLAHTGTAPSLARCELMARTIATCKRCFEERWSPDTVSPQESPPPSAATPTNEVPVESSPMSSPGTLDSSYSLVSAPDQQEMDACEQWAHDEFHATFPVPPEERLVGHVKAILFCTLPVSGRVFVSRHYLAFRSSGLRARLLGRTLMLIPIAHIVRVTREPSFKHGFYGMGVLVQGHEEVFFEYTTSSRRDHCIALLSSELRARQAAQAQRPSDALAVPPLMITHSAESEAPLEGPTPEAHPPLHLTVLTIGSRGDVQPYIALAQRLQSHGHRVRIATHSEFRSWVLEHGVAEFADIGGDPAELMRLCVEKGTFSLAFFREGITKFRTWLDSLLLSCWDACQGTDVVIEAPSAMAGIHVAEALQVPYFRAFTMPWTRTRAYPQAFAVPSHRAGGSFNFMTYVIFDHLFWSASASQVNQWRKTTLGLHPTTLEQLGTDRVPFLYCFSALVVPRPLDWNSWIHPTGYWIPKGPAHHGSYAPPASLQRFLEESRVARRKLVYIGWGSIIVSDAAATTRTVYAAVRRAGVRAVLSKGWSDRRRDGGSAAVTEELQSEDVYCVESIPHDWLFPQLDAACHHGGSGTTGASLRAGLPTVIKPFFGDQFFWARQVEDLGVGLSVPELTEESLASALQLASTDREMHEKAQRLGESLRSEDGVGKAVRALFSDLPYARSLIRTNTRLDPKRHDAEEALLEERLVEMLAQSGTLSEGSEAAGPAA